MVSTRLITRQTSTNIGRFAYLPFGEDASEVSATFPETMRFTGHERDGVETAGWADDLDYMRARYCSPRWGRFLSVDPARESARVGVPQSWNRYSYGLGNPVKFVDPDGRVAETAWDVFNIGIGVASFIDNVRQGNVGAAVLDGVGVVADVAATALPVVPGGAGSAIRAVRAADRAGETGGGLLVLERLLGAFFPRPGWGVSSCRTSSTTCIKELRIRRVSGSANRGRCEERAAHRAADGWSIPYPKGRGLFARAAELACP